MIPTYNPSRRYLEDSLRSVLEQDPGADRMQIEVVDDCSPDVDVGKLVAEIGRGRVAFHRAPRNQGLTGNWNLCIERATGIWVHLLHQDDRVLPGFYEKLRTGLLHHPEVGAAFCRHAYMDGEGHWSYLSEVERPDAGVLEDAAERILTCQRIQTPGIVVRRSLYETEGGYLSHLCYALDWEMWMRLSVKYPFWFEPRILACYRIHEGAETWRLGKSGRKYADVKSCLAIAERRVASGKLEKCCRAARHTYGQAAVTEGMRAVAHGDWRGAFALCQQACALAGLARTMVYLLVKPVRMTLQQIERRF